MSEECVQAALLHGVRRDGPGGVGFFFRLVICSKRCVDEWFYVCMCVYLWLQCRGLRTTHGVYRKLLMAWELTVYIIMRTPRASRAGK